MRRDYRKWLERQGSSENTIRGRISETSRLESYYGDLDALYLGDRLAGLVSLLCYSTEDQRRRRPNPTKIPIDGDLRNNLATYKSAVELYRRFRDSEGDSALPDEPRAFAVDPFAVDPFAVDPFAVDPFASSDEEESQRIGLERDLQAALRKQISQLESGLTIVDGGTERKVESGFIDITARDEAGVTVVVELKAGTAVRADVGQILSYMGDVSTEESVGAVRGILVAHDFHTNAKSAARMVSNLDLRKYSVKFLFSDGHD